MKIHVLGCSGGIGQGLHTTSLLINEHCLIDAGTGIGDLPLSALRKIRHVFLTHSHMDHIAGVPLLVDTIFDSLETPLVVHASKATLKALREHIFNNVIWPDFSVIPTAKKPVLEFVEMAPGEAVDVDGCRVEMIPVNHVIPAVGYRVESNQRAFAFTGDTTSNDSFWERLNRHDFLDLLIVEAAFPDAEIELCRLAYHYCPSLLAADMQKLTHSPTVYISHLKPGSEEKIMDECRQAIQGYALNRLNGGEVLSL